ncbi:MAG: hypothetical protein SF069_00300 [Phycisphaerae bacterium]|nr:hypothetical protein [Phycisphaerae bacterium]
MVGKVLAFIKGNLISLLSGVLAVAFLAVGVIGMGSKHVKEELTKVVGAAGQIDGYIRDPKNPAIIEAEEKRGKEFEAEYARAKDVLARLTVRTPLLTEVFPKPANVVKRFDFKEKYIKEFDALVKKLDGGDLPSPAEVAEQQTEIDALIELQKEAEREGGTAAAGINDPAKPNPRGPGPQPGAAPPGVSTLTEDQKKDPRFNAALRAAVAKAETVRCYIGYKSAQNQRSMHLSPIIRESTPPNNEALWFAQMGYWLQADLIAAIANVNANAAKNLPADAEPNVLALPLKRLERVEILGYVGQNNTLLPLFSRDTGVAAATPDSSGGGGGGQPFGVTNPTGTPGGKSFTGRSSDADFDVIRVEVVMVVDQRDVLLLIDEMARTSFYQCIDFEYAPVEAKERDEGYYYGPDPSVRVRYVFEGYFARTFVNDLMPEEVRKQVGG